MFFKRHDSGLNLHVVSFWMVGLGFIVSCLLVGIHRCHMCCRIKVTLTFDIYLSLALLPFPPWVRRTPPFTPFHQGPLQSEAFLLALEGAGASYSPHTVPGLWAPRIMTLRAWGRRMGAGSRVIAVSFESLSGIPTLFSSLSSAGTCSTGSSCTNRAGLYPLCRRENLGMESIYWPSCIFCLGSSAVWIHPLGLAWWVPAGPSQQRATTRCLSSPWKVSRQLAELCGRLCAVTGSWGYQGLFGVP